MILKNLNFIQSCNFNLIDFLKLRNFYYDLVPLNRIPQNHKIKYVEGKSLILPRQMLPQKCSLPPLWAKLVEGINYVTCHSHLN